MENAVEALKIAGAVLMFILALSLSISCLSSANSSALNIASMYSREREYRYVKPASDFTRTVGIESIIPAMYQAYEENTEIYFKDKNGNPLPLYYKTNQYGKRVDSEGNTVDNSSTRAVTINYINLEKEQIEIDKRSRETLNFPISVGIVSATFTALLTVIFTSATKTCNNLVGIIAFYGTVVASFIGLYVFSKKIFDSMQEDKLRV